MKIRRAEKGDLKEIAEIFKNESNKKPYFQGWTEKTAHKKIINLFKEDEIYVSLVNEKIVGFIITKLNRRKNEFYIDELWLRNTQQGKGIGSALLKYVEDLYSHKGVSTVTVMAHQKARAMDFYKKSKFKEKHTYVYLTKRIR